MPAIIEKTPIPKHPEHVIAAEKKLRAEAPDLYYRVSRFRDCKNLIDYERAKAQMEISHYEKYHKTLADFCNV